MKKTAGRLLLVLATAFFILASGLSSVSQAQERVRKTRGFSPTGEKPAAVAEAATPALRTLASDNPLELFFDFDDAYMYGWEASAPIAWVISYGSLRVEDDGYSDYFHAQYRDDFADVTIEADLRQVQGATSGFSPAFGLIARGNADDNEFYEFDIAIDGYYTIIKMENEGGPNFVDWIFRETVLADWTRSPAINAGAGQWNTLKVACEGDDLQFFINGTEVEKISDNSYFSGKVGLIAWPGNDPYEPVAVEYDNVSIVSADDNDVSYRYYLPYFADDSANATGLALKNMNPSRTAEATYTIYDENGAKLMAEDLTLRPKGQFLNVVGKGLNESGWILVESDVELAGLCFQGSTPNPAYMMDIMLISRLSTILHVPHVAQNDVWDTTHFVCNPNARAIRTAFKYVGQDGRMLKAISRIIPAYGSVGVAMSEVLGDSVVGSGSLEITAEAGIAGFSLYTDIKTGNYNYAGIVAMTP